MKKQVTKKQPAEKKFCTSVRISKSNREFLKKKYGTVAGFVTKAIDAEIKKSAKK